MQIFYISLIFLLGTCFCSFLTLVGSRIPVHQNIIYPRSNCNACSVDLTWYSLIPILGYLIIGGKCQNCKYNIPILLPINEFTFAFSFSIVYFKSNQPILEISILFLLQIFSSMDYLYGIIMPIFFVPFIPLIFFNNYSLMNFLAFFICLFSFSFLTKGLGFGDVEIYSFLALFLPLENCFLIILISCISCILINITKNNEKYKIHFVPYINFAASFVFIVSNYNLI